MKTYFGLLLLVLLILPGCKLPCEVVRMTPSKKPRCEPGERLIKISDKECKGTGYLKNFDCPNCKGCGREFIQTYYNPYTNIAYGRWENCSACCGTGFLLHDLCHGKGWVWRCQTSP